MMVFGKSDQNLFYTYFKKTKGKRQDIGNLTQGEEGKNKTTQKKMHFLAREFYLAVTVYGPCTPFDVRQRHVLLMSIRHSNASRALIYIYFFIKAYNRAVVILCYSQGMIDDTYENCVCVCL